MALTLRIVEVGGRVTLMGFSTVDEAISSSACTTGGLVRPVLLGSALVLCSTLCCGSNLTFSKSPNWNRDLVLLLESLAGADGAVLSTAVVLDLIGS